MCAVCAVLCAHALLPKQRPPRSPPHTQNNNNDNLLKGVLRPENLPGNRADQALFEAYFVFAAIWAFGGGLIEKDGVPYRKNFDKWWRATWTAVKLPSKGSVFDYYVNAKAGKFAPWAELVVDVEYDSALTPMGSVFVPTAETSSLRYFLDVMVCACCCVCAVCVLRACCVLRVACAACAAHF